MWRCQLDGLTPAPSVTEKTDSGRGRHTNPGANTSGRAPRVRLRPFHQCRRPSRLITVSSCHIIRHGRAERRRPRPPRLTWRRTGLLWAVRWNPANDPPLRRLCGRAAEARPRRDRSAGITDRQTNERRQTGRRRGEGDSLYWHKSVNWTHSSPR